MKFSPAALLLYGIPSAAYQTADALLQDVRAAVAGGVTCIQIRIKHVPTQELVALAAPTVQFCKQQHIPCIINDDAEAAALLQADGVHVGQSDCSIQQARAILGKSACIGVSAHNLEEARMAQQGGADYIGCGAVFGSATKQDATPLS
ncbi:MAG: thiamine phosphate synthase, partial [Ruminococcus sp.]